MQTEEEKAGRDIGNLMHDGSYEWGTYSIQDHIVKAIGLPHPQYAKAEKMRHAVEAVKELVCK